MLGAIGQGLKGITTGELSSLTAAGLAQFSTAQIAGMTAAAQTDIKTIFAAQIGTKNILAVANANGASNSPLIEEIQLLRSADPGVVLPGVDTPTGNMLAASALKPLSSLPTSGSGIIYDATDNIVRINGSNLTLSGYDLGSATVYVNGSNDTIEDCNFTATSGWYGVQVLSGDNTTVTNNTFNGEGIPAKLAAWITSKGSVTITGNTFIDTPSDGIDLFGSGVISENSFLGAGYTSNGTHPDAIWISDNSGPISITDNFIDWATNPNSNSYANDCIRITNELGSVSNVTVTGNFLFGGETSIQAINPAATTSGATAGLSNISITKNYMGFAAAWGFYPGSTAGVTETGNVTFDYSNPAYAANAWAAYQAAGLPTKNVLVSTGGSTINASSETGSTTLYGSAVAHMYGGIGENNFVPNGRNYIFAGGGANIFTYLSPTGDTAQSGIAAINGFDPAKDVIDLSHIDADLTAAGQQNFTFIGTNAFTGAGAQVNYQYDPSDNLTTVEATLAGDATPDWETTLTGQVTLTAANFALTPAQSTADLADGTALSITAVRSGNAEEYNYSNVQGRSYSSYSSVDWNNGVAADDLNLSAASNEVDLFESGATITRGASAESFAIGAAPIGGSFALGYPPTKRSMRATRAPARRLSTSAPASATRRSMASPRRERTPTRSSCRPRPSLISAPA